MDAYQFNGEIYIYVSLPIVGRNYNLSIFRVDCNNRVCYVVPWIILLLTSNLGVFWFVWIIRLNNNSCYISYGITRFIYCDTINTLWLMVMCNCYPCCYNCGKKCCKHCCGCSCHSGEDKCVCCCPCKCHSRYPVYPIPWVPIPPYVPYEPYYPPTQPYWQIIVSTGGTYVQRK